MPTSFSGSSGPVEAAPGSFHGNGAALLVTVLPVAEGDGDRVAWLEASKEALARAFADNEPEYAIADIRR
jgi:hypothetical protein